MTDTLIRTLDKTVSGNDICTVEISDKSSVFTYACYEGDASCQVFTDIKHNDRTIHLALNSADVRFTDSKDLWRVWNAIESDIKSSLSFMLAKKDLRVIITCSNGGCELVYSFKNPFANPTDFINFLHRLYAIAADRIYYGIRP